MQHSLQSSILKNSKSGAPLEHIEQEAYQEAAMGEAQKVSITTSPRMRLFALGVNVLVVAELTVAMYFAAQNQPSFTPVFFKVFFGLLAPTLVAAFIGKRLIAKADAR